MAIYKNVGGGLPLPGQVAQANLHNDLYGPDGVPLVDTSGGTQAIIQQLAEQAADPRNVPEYYTDTTVAGFDPLQNIQQERLVDVAGQQDTITNQLLADFQAQLDPNSALNQQAITHAATAANAPYVQTGSLGSARNQIAANQAAQNQAAQNRANALAGISSQRGSLGLGAETLGQVGKDRQDLTQDYIDEDILRHTAVQQLPIAQQDRILALQQASEAFKQGQPGAAGGGTNPFDSLLNKAVGGISSGLPGGIGDIFGGLFSNDGGELGDPNAPSMQDPANQGMMPQDPFATPMAPPAAPMPQQSGITAGPDAMMSMNMTMMTDEPQSDLDIVEETVRAISEASGGNITVKRKSKNKGK